MRPAFASLVALLALGCGAADPVASDDSNAVTPGNGTNPSPTDSSTGPDSPTPVNSPGVVGPTPVDPNPNGTPSPVVGPTPIPDVTNPGMPSAPVTNTPPTPVGPIDGTGGAPPDGSGGTPVTVGGSGGTPDPGGAGSPSGGAGGTPTPTTVGCTGTELLCEDFEDVAVDMVPSGGPWQPLDASCEFQTASFTMGVTADMANGGSQSLRVTNKHFAQCRLSGNFGMADEFWVRAYMYWDPTLDISNRETLAIDLTPGYRAADDPAVRFGYRSKSPCEEYAGPQVTLIGFPGGEATGCGSRPMPQGEWFCFEAHVQQASVLDVRTYINREAITYQSTGKEATESIMSTGAITEKVDHIRLGIFSTGEAIGNIYIDDVAVNTTRLGCGGD